jgi:hypothetical protein
VAIATLTLFYFASTAVSLIASQQNSSALSTWSKFDAQQQCLRTAITREVPQGTRFYIPSDQGEWHTGELAELSIPWATPVVSRAQATYTLAIVPGSQCEGESLQVETTQ